MTGLTVLVAGALAAELGGSVTASAAGALLPFGPLATVDARADLAFVHVRFHGLGAPWPWPTWGVDGSLGLGWRTDHGWGAIVGGIAGTESPRYRWTAGGLYLGWEGLHRAERAQVDGMVGLMVSSVALAPLPLGRVRWVFDRGFTIGAELSVPFTGIEVGWTVASRRSQSSSEG